VEKNVEKHRFSAAQWLKWRSEAAFAGVNAKSAGF
jgi:hypothetical protein